jgi:hypothetical protein
MRRRTPALLCAPLCALALSACGTAVSTSSFKGTQHDVAQTLANLQSDATANDEAKICSRDLAATIVSRLGGAKRCEKAIKDQLKEADNLELKVESVSVTNGASTATARVRSIFLGKHQLSTVALVKDGSDWKISSLG